MTTIRHCNRAVSPSNVLDVATKAAAHVPRSPDRACTHGDVVSWMCIFLIRRCLGIDEALAIWRVKRQYRHSLKTPRRRASKGAVLDVENQSIAAPGDGHVDVRLDAEWFMSRLPRRERELLWRRFWLGETYKEAGAAIGIGRSTAQYVEKAALNQLREIAHRREAV